MSDQPTTAEAGGAIFYYPLCYFNNLTEEFKDVMASMLLRSYPLSKVDSQGVHSTHFEYGDVPSGRVSNFQILV